MPTRSTKQIAIVLYPGLTPLDLVGPLQALSAIPRVDPTYEVMVVGETLDPVLSDSVISLAPSHTFDDVPSPFAIVVPGGGDPTLRRRGPQAARRLRRRSWRRTPRSSCRCAPGRSSWPPPGSCRAGEPTTHWAYTDVLANLGVDVVRRPAGSRTASTSRPPACPLGSTAESTSSSVSSATTSPSSRSSAIQQCDLRGPAQCALGPLTETVDPGSHPKEQSCTVAPSTKTSASLAEPPEPLAHPRRARRSPCSSPRSTTRSSTSPCRRSSATSTRRAAQLQWIVAAYTVVFAGLLLTAGSLGDRFGRRHALAAGLATFMAGSVLSALAGTTTMLIAGRGVMGVGGALIMPTTLSILVNCFGDPRERAKAIAIWTAVAGAGIALGPIVGGFLMRSFSWSSVFWINVPVLAVALLGTLHLVPDSRGPARHPARPRRRRRCPSPRSARSSTPSSSPRARLDLQLDAA